MPRSDTYWKPGQSGNPAGRKKGQVSTWQGIKKRCREKAKAAGWEGWTDPRTGITTDDPDEVAYLQMQNAVLEGQAWAVQNLLDRSAGKPHQAISVEDHNPHTEDLDELSDVDLAAVIAQAGYDATGNNGNGSEEAGGNGSHGAAEQAKSTPEPA